MHRSEQLRLAQQPRERPDDLKVAHRVASRRRDEEHDARGVLDVPFVSRTNGSRGNADGDEQLTDRLGAHVHEKGAVAHRDDVLSTRLGHALTKPYGIEHAVCARDALQEGRGGLLERQRLERDDDPLGREKVPQLHPTGYMRARSSSTKSIGRLATPIPAFSNDSIFSAAVPADPEMIAPAWPMRRPGGAV